MNHSDKGLFVFVTSAHILDVGDEVVWKSFGDNLIVGRDVQGSPHAFPGSPFADSADECKKEGKNATINNVKFCNSSWGTKTCWLYNGQLTGEEQTHYNEYCTTYYKKPNPGNNIKACY